VAKFSQLSITVSNGDGTKSTVTISIPAAAASDPFATSQSSGQDSASQNAGVSGLVQTVARVGFWDSAGANFYPPAAIVKITPQ